MSTQPNDRKVAPDHVDADRTPKTPENNQDLSPTQRAAPAYAADHGLLVFPCVPGEKRPATGNGCKDATDDAQAIRRAFLPSHNLAIATGEASGIFVLDVDGDEGEASLAGLVTEHGELPGTVTARTPRGGRHLYFRWPRGGDVRNSASKIGGKLDVRGEGGYVVAPPSELPNGAYRWARGRSIAEVPIAEAPGWLLGLVTHAKRGAAPRAEDGQVPEGRRNETLTSVAGTIRRIGLGRDAIEAALLAHNNSVCSPPMPVEEVRAIARSVARYDFEDRALRVPAFKPFPTDALPRVPRSYVERTAEAMGCDTSYLALPLLAAAASAIGNTRRIALKTGWTEPAILWTAIVGDSGTMKSPALEAALQPIKRRQQQAMEAHEFTLAEHDGARLLYERELALWKKKSSSEPPPEKPADPIAPRNWVDDLTIEALAVLLQHQPRGLLVACDELASWFGGFDRYSQSAGGDAARWLEMYGGRQIVIDRKTGDRRTIFVPRAAVSVTGGIQLGVLRRALTPQHRESGLAARLLLTCPPRTPKAWSEERADPALGEQLAALFDRLYALQGADQTEKRIDPIVLPLSTPALGLWKAFFNQHAEEQASLEGDLSAAWSKLEGAAARLALVLHLVENDGDDRPITLIAMRRALRLIDWFKHEATRVYALLKESQEEGATRSLLERIRRQGGSITTREMQRSSRQWPTADAAERDLNELRQAGLGDWEIEPPTNRGGAPGRVFRLREQGNAAVDRT